MLEKTMMIRMVGFLMFVFLLAVGFMPTKAMAGEYRLEHNACSFSMVFPGAPSVVPIWPGDERVYARFLVGAPLRERPDNIRALKVAYYESEFMSGDSLMVDVYCMEFDPEMSGESFSPSEMLVMLKNAIDQNDPERLKKSFSQASVDMVEQENGIRWMKLRALVEETQFGYNGITAYARDVFVFKNHALILFIRYSAENKKYQQDVNILMSSFMLTE